MLANLKCKLRQHKVDILADMIAYDAYLPLSIPKRYA